MNAIKRLEKAVGSSAGQIEKSFSGIGKGIDRSFNTSVQKRINEITGVGAQATKEWTGALADQSRELDRMRARFNPIFATVQRYKNSVTEIQTAHRLGAISANEMTAAIQRERQAALASIAALKQRNSLVSGGPRNNSFNSANLAAQFQDIGVTAAMGMSPLQIALQQGTQISAVLNQMGKGRDIVAGLGSAIASVINPISLVTIGLVAATAAAVQYGSSLWESSEDAEKALKEQEELIQRVAQKWGEALPGVKAYADELQRAADMEEKRGATGATIEREYNKASAALATFVNLMNSANFSAFDQSAGQAIDSVAKLEDAVKNLEAAQKAGKDTTEEFERVQSILSSLINNTVIVATDALKDAAYDLADAYDAAAGAARRLSDALPRPGTEGRVGRETLDEAQQRFDFRRQFSERMYPERFEAVNRGVKEPKKRGGSRIPPRTADDRFFEDIEAIRQRTRALAEEQALLGMSFEAQTKRRVAFDLEQQALKQVREEARRKGDQDWQNAQLSSQQVQAIDEVSAAYARQADELRRSQENMEFQRDVLQGIFSDFRSALDDGKLDWEDFGNIALNVLDKIINKIEDDLIDAIMSATSTKGSGGGLGGLLGSIFGGGTGMGLSPAVASVISAGGVGLFAKGGITDKPAIFGESGTEAAVPLPDGRRIPVDLRMPRLAGAMAQAPAYNDHRVISIDARGAQQGVGEEIRRALAAYDKQMPIRVAQINRDPRAR